MATSSFNPSVKDLRKDNARLENAKEAAGEAWNKATEAGGEAIEAAKEAATDAFGKVRQAGTATLEKAKETAASAGEMAVETAAALGQKADQMTGAAGHGIKTFGETIAEKSPREGVAGYASQTVAGSVKGAGEYVEEHKLSGMARDLERLVSNHPIPTALIVFGIGVCVGRALKD